MKIKVKIISIFFIAILAYIILSLCNTSQANSISKISMDIYVDNNGNAQITEVWNCNATSGTEVYHPYYNLGNSKVTDLTVFDNNVKYTTLSSWNTSGSLDSKANKCGINMISNGLEICWGISSYGTHTYTVKYTITNFVSELNDSQMIYWTLIPYKFSNAIGSVYIKIHTNSYIEDTIDVWGYGNYGGTAYVYDGYIEMQSKGSLNTDEYMTILVKFPLGTFKTTNKLDHNFEYYYNLAEEGTEHYSEEISPKKNMLGLLVIYFAMYIVLYLFIAFIKKISSSKSTFNFGKQGKHIPKNVPYYRDIPCDKDIFKAYYIGHQYGIIKSKTDILGAIILKWLKDSLIKLEQKEKGNIFKKENTVIVLNETDTDNITNEDEKRLFNMLLEASNDGILENKEFEKWCKKSYYRILSWFDSIISSQKKELIKEGLIILEEKVSFKIIKTKRYTATPELKEEAIKLAGLKRYLLNYTLISEREPIEVQLFEEYLIYAQMMGIAKKVAKQFKNLYPELIETSNFYSYDNITFINLCASHGISKAYSSQNAESRASSYSSGGGGFSSRGGGGGSRGGRWKRRRIPLKYERYVIIKG
ncbi:MAG: DUF2207 domain-containing protein [Clostridia bacterium]|nr:DUF2207 domain-containing protein [Clostridia bacterium]